MRSTLRLLGYQLSDVARSRWLAGYTLFFLVVTDALLRFGGGGTRALLGLMNVVLLVVPLVSAVFGTTYLYDTREYTELLLAQPVSRRQLYAGLYLGLTVPLALGFAAGVGAPFLLHGAVGAGQLGTLVTLLFTGCALSFVFTALAFVIALRFDDRIKGLGVAIAVWLGLAVLYDGLVLVLVAVFADYPLERAVLGLMVANPVDLARVMLLLQFDVSALMGYTGAVFRKFFGSAGGMTLAVVALALWAALPAALGARLFRRKDF